MSRLIKYYLIATRKLVIFFLVAICFSIFLQIIVRLFNFTQFSFTLEIIQLCLLLLVAFTLPLVLFSQELLKIQIFNLNTNLLLKVLTFLAGILLLFSSCKLGIQNWWQKTPLLKIPLGLGYLAFLWTAIGFIFYALTNHDS